MKQSIEAVLGSENVVLMFNNFLLKTLIIQAIWLRLQLRRITIYTTVVGVQTTKTLQAILISLMFNLVVLCKILGIEPGEVNDKAKAVGLDVYTQMLEEANKEQDLAKRYEKVC